ncbi:dATP/dGTP diphosphohydrolase domain-containing protein [Amycolatopsis sp. NPDC004772]
MDDTGTRQEFPGGGMRDTAAGKPRFELLWTDAQPYGDQMLTRAARWMARGAEKYESRNWELFDSPEALEHAKASLLRHTFKLLAGETDEDHAAAVWFNSQVIEYVRWKFKQSLQLEMMADAIASTLAMTPPNVRYWVDEDDWYYRWDGEELTFVDGPFRVRERSGNSVHRYLDGDGYGAREIPVDEVPEWAR